MNERRPMSGRFHHAGLLFIPLLPIGIALIDLTLLGHTWRPYLWAALWVVPWHLVQLRLDYRHSEIWYVRLTSPPYRVNFRQFLSLLWPALVALIPDGAAPDDAPQRMGSMLHG